MSASRLGVEVTEVQPVAYRPLGPRGDPLVLIVLFPWPHDGFCSGQFRAAATETDQQVTVGTVTSRIARGPGGCAGLATVGGAAGVELKLTKSLGRRRVVRATDSSTLPQLPVGSSLPAADFSTNQPLNGIAGSVANALTARVAAQPGFAGFAIVPAGLELSWVGTPPTWLNAAIFTAQAGAADSLKGLPGAPSDGLVPVRIRPAAYSQAQLDAMTRRIVDDADYWKTHGIELSSWGPDGLSNRLLVHLQVENPAAQAMFTARYGPIVTVAPGTQDVAWR
jgi:hypothetical protein